MRRCIALAAVFLSLTAAAEKRRSARSSSGWNVPQCAAIAGIPAISISLDGGRTVLPHVESSEDFEIYTFGVTPAERPNQLLAAANLLLLRSDDAGCTWTIDPRLALPQKLARLVRAGNGVWAWSILGPELFFITQSSVTARTAPVPLPLTFFAAGEGTLAVADDQGDIHWSDDAGATWMLHAKAPARPPLYALEFSSRAHAIATGLADGAFVTLDGGATWTASRGLEGLNVFRVAFSPLDANIVWAMALDPRGEGESRRAIYHSADAGRTFRKVLTASEDVQMTNGFPLAPHPVDRALLYFAINGTTLYLLDTNGAIVQRATLQHRDINAIAFSPASPSVMYFGLKLGTMSGD